MVRVTERVWRVPRGVGGGVIEVVRGKLFAFY